MERTTQDLFKWKEKKDKRLEVQKEVIIKARMRFYTAFNGNIILIRAYQHYFTYCYN